MQGSFLTRLLSDLIEPFSPDRALHRDIAATKRRVLASSAAHYEGAGGTKRSRDFRKNRSDAVEAARMAREPMRFMSRDMLRNNPRVRRIQRQLRNGVVGSGIRPSVRWKPRVAEVEGDVQRIRALIAGHCLTTDIDVDGLSTMFGQQGLGFGTIVIDGEVLFRRRMRRAGDGFGLPFQVQMLETDYLDQLVDGELPNGNYAVQGIEFNRIGRRVAYHLFPEHPGGRRGLALSSRRISAENIIHAFDPERAGQQRGVSWLAPVITKLHELDKYQDGQIKRQEIAALFSAFITSEADASEFEDDLEKMAAGTIFRLGENEQIEFTDPPSVEGYSDFMRATDRVIAAAMGLTYEGLTGDYSQVNYTSGRMGRMDVDPNIKDWQENLMIAQVCHGFGRWIGEAVEDVTGIDREAWDLKWTAPVRPVVDPTKDHKADETAMRSGKKSRRQVITESGRDPEEVEAEILAERTWEAEHSIAFTSNAAAVPSPAGSGTPPSNEETENDD